ncbi:hypothetical protein DSUL_80032 [Desulfovibrionales bacterium]
MSEYDDIFFLSIVYSLINWKNLDGNLSKVNFTVIATRNIMRTGFYSPRPADG